MQCSSHSNQCWRCNAITPADNQTASPLSRRASWLVLQCCMLTAPDFHQSRTPYWCSCYSHYVYLCCSSLSRASADPEPGWPWKSVATAFEVAYGWSVNEMVFYDVIITASRHLSVRRLLVADLPQLDQVTWCTSMHLIQRLCVITAGPRGRGCW